MKEATPHVRERDGFVGSHCHAESDPGQCANTKPGSDPLAATNKERAVTEPTHRPRTKCRQCGESHRGKYDICRACRTRSKADIYPEREIALTGGRWVRRGGILVWDGPVPEETQDSTDSLIDTLAQNLRAGAIVNKKPEPAFCACGCWLITKDEDCPACMARVEWLPWAQRSERRHNLATFGRAA